jgi:VCBS repeat-containing protein
LGDTKEETFTVTSADGTAIETITVTITGTNDGPNIINGSVAFDENANSGTSIYNVSDSFTGTDFDLDGDAITYSITGGNPDGIFEIDPATGEITIAAGKTLDWETASIHNLTVTATDGSLSDTATITVNVNDLVTEAFNDTGSVNENATLTVGLPGVLANDYDNLSNPITVSAVNAVAGNVGNAVSGVYGSLTLNANGSYTYVANNAESLAAGVTASDVFTYTISNGVGGSDTATLTITLTGTNDLPVFSGDSTGAVTEDDVLGNLTTSGTLIVTDVDSGDSSINPAVPVVSVGYNLGSLVINAAGEWTYTVANDDVQYLGDGETRNEVFTVTSVDGSTHNITVTITGTQDDPTAQDANIPIPKNATHVLTADDFGIVDADSSDTLTVTITSVPGQGALKYYDGSAWVNVVSNSTIPYADIENGLLVYVPATDDTGNESFTYTVTDGTYATGGNTVTFSINIELTVSSPLPVDEGKATVFAVELSDARTVATVLDLTLGGDAASDDYVTPMQYRIQNADGSYTAWQNVVGGQITLAIGQTRAEVKVKTEVNDDGLGVTSESLTLTATTTAAADLANASATGETSINDLPSLMVSGASYVSEGGITSFDLELSNVKSTDTVVTLSFEGVATLGVDFDYSIDGGVTWISSATSIITLTGDALSNPTFELQVRTLTDVAVESDEVLRVVAVTTDVAIANSSSQVTASTLVVDPIVASTSEDNAVTVLSGASYNYAVLGQAGHGTVTNSGGDIIYTPDSNWSGTDSFTITKTNEVGLSVTSVVTVNVAAVADAPNVTISISPEPQNTTTSSTTTTVDVVNDALWIPLTTGGGGGATLTNGTLTLSTSNGQLDRNGYAQQTITGLSSNQTYTFTANISNINNVVVTWGGQVLTGTLVGGTTSTYSFSVTEGTGTTPNVLRFQSAPIYNASVKISNVVLNVSTTTVDVLTYTYDVDVSAALTDTDGSETLGSTVTVTSSDLPAGAVLKYFNGTSWVTVADADGSGAYSWTVPRAFATGMQLTVNEAAGTQFTLTATATSSEAVGGPATGTVTTATITMPASGTSVPNPVPTIDDATATLSNLIQTQDIATNFGDGTNTFSWVSVADSLPEIYANGELVQYSLVVSPDGQVGTITGYTSAGDVFELVITLGSPNAVAEYTQFMSLQGSEVVATGDTMVGGGNGSEFVLTFGSGADAFNAVVTGTNYVDGTPTTVNTSSKYIGAANNLMNPGEQVTMDFASGSSGNAVASMQISLFNFDSASGSAPDELTIYGATVDGSQFTYVIKNSSLDANGFYTITAPGDELISQLTFEAGSQSSFKLGIESVSSVQYDPSFTLDLTYQLTDGSGDSDTGTIQLTLGGGDAVIGTSGNDTLVGTSFDDILSGGAGNDVLTGGAGDDVFKWSLADAGTAGTPAVDTITDFGTGGVDALDLRDLLPNGLTTPTTLDNYLHFEVTGGNTIVHVSTSGGFADNNSVGVGSPVISLATETQQIVLTGVDLSAGGLSTDQQIIQNLISNQKLITD